MRTPAGSHLPEQPRTAVQGAVSEAASSDTAESLGGYASADTTAAEGPTGTGPDAAQLSPQAPAAPAASSVSGGSSVPAPLPGLQPRGVVRQRPAASDGGRSPTTSPPAQQLPPGAPQPAPSRQVPPQTDQQHEHLGEPLHVQHQQQQTSHLQALAKSQRQQQLQHVRSEQPLPQQGKLQRQRQHFQSADGEEQPARGVARAAVERLLRHAQSLGLAGSPASADGESPSSTGEAYARSRHIDQCRLSVMRERTCIWKRASYAAVHGLRCGKCILMS